MKISEDGTMERGRRAAKAQSGRPTRKSGNRGQKELFNPAEYARRSYPAYDEDDDDADQQAGSPYESSVRATRIKARDAAAEALGLGAVRRIPDGSISEDSRSTSGQRRPPAADELRQKASGSTGAAGSPGRRPAAVRGPGAGAGVGGEGGGRPASPGKGGSRSASGSGRSSPGRAAPRPGAAAVPKRGELLKFAIITLLLIIAGWGIAHIVLRQEPRYQDAVAETPEGTVRLIDAEVEFADTVKIYIPSGMRASEVCRLLQTAGVVQHAGRLQTYLLQQGLDTKIRSGFIILPLDMSSEDAAAALVRGYWEHPMLKVYDGYTLKQIDGLLSLWGLAGEGEFLKAAELTAQRAGLPFAEGWFFPGTYTLKVNGTSAAQLASLMLDQFFRVADPLRERLSIDGRTLEQAVIVGSMIQRETANSEEMPWIAGIIWKRLDEGMPLGIDATTRYEIDDWSSPLTREVLEDPTPYNTRRRRGLPPTAIANPGFEALQAAVFPRQSPYYYYLHDRTGTIRFAVTYAEHLENVEQYLR